MALDLKCLTDEVIAQMGWSKHELWLVKHEGEIFGPFEVESLKHYATENEAMFEIAQATRMDVNNWQPFYAYSEFHPIAEHAHADEPKHDEKYWILNLGQKSGPLGRKDIDKKMELGLISLADLVSMDNGDSWQKFYQLDTFNSHSGNSDELPMAPLESSFQKAREEINEKMDAQEASGSQSGLAGLAFIAQTKEKVTLKLEEMDLKSLSEVSRSLKWAIPGAVAGIGVLALLGNFLFSPSTEMHEVADNEKKSEVIMPKTAETRPRPTMRPVPRQVVREPSSYPQHNRSDLTRPPITHSEPYQRHVETHNNEPDPMTDPVSEADVLPPPDQTQQEHSLVSNQAPPGEGQSLDQSMGGGSENPMPEQPVIEEASDF